MDENSVTFGKEISYHEISSNPLVSIIPKESNISNRVQKENIIHDINEDLKCLKGFKINLDKEIKKNIFKSMEFKIKR